MTHRAATAARSRRHLQPGRRQRQLRLHLRRRPERAQPERDRLRRGRQLRLRDSLAVTVNNVAPTIAIERQRERERGLGLHAEPGRGQRTGDDTVTDYVVHWGDGSSDTYNSNGDKTHTYADGPDNHAITVDLVDEDDTYPDAANALSVHVNNVAHRGNRHRHL